MKLGKWSIGISSGGSGLDKARRMIVFNCHLPAEEIVARIGAVDKDAILRVAQRIFKSPLALAALGSISKQQPFEPVEIFCNK